MVAKAVNLGKTPEKQNNPNQENDTANPSKADNKMEMQKGNKSGPNPPNETLRQT